MLMVPLKLVTIVAEAILRDHLTAELKHLGAKGFTIIDARGDGSRHLRAGELPGENVRIDTIVSAAVAERILEHVAREYFSNYAVIAYVSDVAVVRGEKYV